MSELRIDAVARSRGGAVTIAPSSHRDTAAPPHRADGAAKEAS